MDNFISIEILGTLVGCSAIVTLLTQVLKKYIPETVDTKWLALLLSVIVGVLRIFYIADFTYAGIVTGIINIFVLLAVSVGIYEIANTAYTSIKKEE